MIAVADSYRKAGTAEARTAAAPANRGGECLVLDGGVPPPRADTIDTTSHLPHGREGLDVPSELTKWRLPARLSVLSIINVRVAGRVRSYRNERQCHTPLKIPQPASPDANKRRTPLNSVADAWREQVYAHDRDMSELRGGSHGGGHGHVPANRGGFTNRNLDPTPHR